MKGPALLECSERLVTAGEDKRKQWAGGRKAGAMGWHRPSGEPHVVSGVQLTLPALLERSGKLWAPGRPANLYTGGSSPLPFVSLEGAQDPTVRGDDHLGASEKRFWPGSSQNLAEEEQQLQSEEELVSGHVQVRPLCLSGGSTEGPCPP